MNSKPPFILILFALTSFFWADVTVAAVEPVGQGAVTSISGISYFQMTVNFSKPADAEGVLVVVRQSYAPASPPVDGTVYTADPRIGTGDTTVPGCVMYCEYVVADEAADGSVTVTGLKEGINHYFVVYSYNGTGTDINYNRTISATMATTAAVPLEGTSHNELWVAAPGDGTGGGTMTSADCANCHGSHHTSQLLPTGDAMANKCFTCHSDAGDVSMHAGGSVDCGTCHSLHSFRTEELYSNSPEHTANQGFNRSFVRANMAKYLNTTNGFTADALEPTIFQTTSDYGYTTADYPAGPFNAACQSCHVATEVNHYTQSGGDGHRAGQNCALCHSHKQTEGDAFRPGHQVNGAYQDFGSDSECTGCHDPDPALGGVLDGIHGNGIIADCTLCHAGTPTRGNERMGIDVNGDGVDGSALEADGTAEKADLGTADAWSSVTCLTCHPTNTYLMPTVHHNPSPEATSGPAVEGFCIDCHKPDVNQGPSARTRTDLDIVMPRGLPCNWCHLYWPNNSYSLDGNDRVRIYSLRFNPNSTEWGIPATTNVLTTHSISKSSQPISDYGACFACHGATSYTGTLGIAAPQVKPFHGLGTPYTNSNDPATGGDFDDIINAYSGSTRMTGTDQPKHEIPFHPGFNALNWLAGNVGYNRGGSRTQSPYANASGRANFHLLDLDQHERADAVYVLNGYAVPFNIPWDNYDPGIVTPPVNISVNVGIQGTSDIPATIPTLPLTLP
jgi:hypothetical protein